MPRLCCYLSCVALLFQLPTQSALAGTVRSKGAIVTRISPDRLVYRLGDPIRLRLTLKNESSDQLYVGNSPPYFLVNLEVFDWTGRVLPHRKRDLRVMGSVRACCAWNLAPGKPVVIGFPDPDDHWQNNDRVDIKKWGYDIGKPGTYTIVAVPEFVAFGRYGTENGAPEVTARRPSDASAQVSNKISITVTRGARGPLLRYAATPNPLCPHPNADATVTNAVQPVYPALARDSTFGSVTVRVEVTVGPSANLVVARVVKGSGNLLIDEAALRAARESTYSPKLVNCLPTSGKYLFRADFQP